VLSRKGGNGGIKSMFLCAFKERGKWGKGENGGKEGSCQ